jgi:5'-nucleotidase
MCALSCDVLQVLRGRRVSYWRVRVLVTNDDGVHAPGLAAITRALDRWSHDEEGRHEIVVVAPLANHSGASAAVGTVYEREAISYRRVRIEGAEDVPTYGVDAPPALAVLVGTLGGFGPRPDVVVSGINLGVNVGRSVLHSGTVGATLTGAQLGLRGLAVSLRSGFPPEQWSTAASIAVALVPALGTAPPRTVLNLNVPSVPIEELRGVRRARISMSGIVRQARGDAGGLGGPANGGSADEGEVRLTLGAAIPTLGRTDEPADPEDDAALVAAGYASITPIVGVREDAAPDSDEVVRAALSTVHEVLGL